MFHRLTGWFFVCAGLLTALGSWFSPLFRDPEGFPSRQVCFVCAAGIAVAVFGAGLLNRWVRLAFWLGLAIVGQAAALQSIDAGPLVHYQHCRASHFHPTVLAVLAIQALCVAAGVGRYLRPWYAWLRRTFPAWALIGIGAIPFGLSATVSREISFYIAELAFAIFVQLVNTVNVVLFAAELPGSVVKKIGGLFEKVLGASRSPVDPAPGRVDRFALVAAVWVTVVSAALNVFVYERHPHIPDEVVYLYHARYFAAGMLTMPLPPAPNAFDIDLMTYEKDRWFCPVPPGWPAILAIGALLGVPSLVNPVLGGIDILLAYVFLREMYSLRVARMAVLLLCVSPWYVFMAMNFMTHTFTLTCMLIAGLGVMRCRRTGNMWWALAAGLATGIGSTIRPLDGLIVAASVGVWILGFGARRLSLPAMAAFALGTVITGAAVLPYNKLLTGDPMRAPLMAYTDKYYGPKTNAMGFGPERGLGWGLDPYPGHSPLESVINANLNASSINGEMFGWSAGSLLLAVIMLFSGALRRPDWELLVMVAITLGAYSLYWFSGGPDFGARYWYLVLIAGVALTARAVQWLDERTGMRALPAIACLGLMALVNYFPWRSVDKYHHYLRMRPDVRALAARHAFGRSLVLVRGERFPDYESAAIYNPLDFHAAAPVYAWDRNPKVRAEALRAFSDRPVWVLEGPTITKGGFRVVSGPTPATDLLKASP